MNVSLTWQDILPLYFFHRSLVFAIGAGMFIHFLCMANFAHPKSPWQMLAFLGVIGGSSIGMMATAYSGDMRAMVDMIIIGAGTMFLFWLWLWFRGMQIKRFIIDQFHLK